MESETFWKVRLFGKGCFFGKEASWESEAFLEVDGFLGNGWLFYRRVTFLRNGDFNQGQVTRFLEIFGCTCNRNGWLSIGQLPVLGTGGFLGNSWL